MTAKTIHTCDGCGATMGEADAAVFYGVHTGQSAVAAGLHAWHSCGASCAAKHLRSVADAIEARGRHLDAEKQRVIDDRAKFAAAQASLAAIAAAHSSRT